MDDLVAQLTGRAQYLEDMEQVKSPTLMREAAQAITDLQAQLAEARGERDASRRVTFLLQESGAVFHKTIRQIQADCPPEIAERINKALAHRATLKEPTHD